MPTLPAGLPSISRAKLPATYEAAKVALNECSQIDECKDWADKAEALASYAKQADDDALRTLADRIQARAIRRCGELFKQIKRPEQGGRPSGNGGSAAPVSRAQAARDAGLSRDQKRDAIRVANIPEDEFEAAVESGRPPTVGQLAERGKQPRRNLLDLKGRDPDEFRRATQAQGLLRSLVEFAADVDPAEIARGAFPKERAIMRRQVETLIHWLRQLNVRLQKEKGS